MLTDPHSFVIHTLKDEEVRLRDDERARRRTDGISSVSFEREALDSFRVLYTFNSDLVA